MPKNNKQFFLQMRGSTRGWEKQFGSTQDTINIVNQKNANWIFFKLFYACLFYLRKDWHGVTIPIGKITVLLVRYVWHFFLVFFLHVETLIVLHMQAILFEDKLPGTVKKLGRRFSPPELQMQTVQKIAKHLRTEHHGTINKIIQSTPWLQKHFHQCSTSAKPGDTF